jgi:hypothetical protein
MKYLLPLCLVLVGCIHEPTAVVGLAPGTPAPNPRQISSCENTRNWHNIWTIAATIFGGGAGAQGAVDAADSDKKVQTAMGIGAAATGILAAVSTLAAGMDADAFSTDNCETILSEAFVGAPH